MNSAGRLLLLGLAAAPLMAAANPFIGTWKANVAKSIWSDGSAEQSALISIEPAADNRVKITQEIVNAAGRKSRNVEEYPLDGTEIHPSGQAPI